MDKIKELINERVQDSQSLKIKYEDQIEFQDLYQAKKAEKLRQIKENVLIDALFNFGQASKGERQLFEAQSSEVMTCLNYRFYYQAKNRGLFSDIAEMYISFFESLKFESRAEEIRVIAKYNLYQNVPFLCMLLKWLIEISRKIFADTMTQAKTCAENYRSKKQPLLSKSKNGNNINSSAEKIKQINKNSQQINNSNGNSVEEEKKIKDISLKVNNDFQQTTEIVNSQEEGKQQNRKNENEGNSTSNMKGRQRYQSQELQQKQYKIRQSREFSIDMNKQQNINNHSTNNTIPSIAQAQKQFKDTQIEQNNQELLNQLQRNSSNTQYSNDDQYQYDIQVNQLSDQKLDNSGDQNDENILKKGEQDNQQVINRIQGSNNKTNNILIKSRIGDPKPLIEKSKKRKRDMVFHNVKECINDVEFIVQKFHDYLINFHVKLILQRNTQIKNSIDEYRVKSMQNFQNTFAKLDPGLLYSEENKANTLDTRKKHSNNNSENSTISSSIKNIDFLQKQNLQQVSKIMNTSYTDIMNIDNQDTIEFTEKVTNIENNIQQENKIKNNVNDIQNDNINNNQMNKVNGKHINNNINLANKFQNDNYFINPKQSSCSDLSYINLLEEQERKPQRILIVSQRNNKQQQQQIIQNSNVINQTTNNQPQIKQNERQRLRALSQLGGFQQNYCKQDKSLSPLSQNIQSNYQISKEFAQQNSIQFKQYQFVPQFLQRNSPDFNKLNIKNIKNSICNIAIPKNTELNEVDQNTLNSNNHINNQKYQIILNTKQSKFQKNLMMMRAEKPLNKTYQYQTKDFNIDQSKDYEDISNPNQQQKKQIYNQNQNMIVKLNTSDLNLPSFNQNKKNVNTTNENNCQNNPNSSRTPKKISNNMNKKSNQEGTSNSNTLNTINITERTELINKQTHKNSNALTTNSDCFIFEDEFSNVPMSQHQNKEKYKQPKNARILFQQIQNTYDKYKINQNPNTVSYLQSNPKSNKQNNCYINSQSNIVREAGNTLSDMSQLDLSMRYQQTKNLEKQISLPTDFTTQIDIKSMKQNIEDQAQQNQNNKMNQYRCISGKSNKEKVNQKIQLNQIVNLTTDNKQNISQQHNQNNTSDLSIKNYQQRNQNNLINKLNKLDVNQITYQFSS